MYLIRWVTSKSVRQAADLAQQARKILNAQRDQLAPQAITAVTQAIEELEAAIKSGAKAEVLDKLMDKVEQTAAKWFKPYPNAAVRENVEMFLTTTAVLLGVFTFFIQHFAIPTGSMQPTLYGIHGENHAGDPNFVIPTGARRLYERWVHGAAYYHIVAPTDGTIEEVEPPRSVPPLGKRQRFRFAGQTMEITFPPLFPVPDLERLAGLAAGRSFKRGEDILKLKVTSGDHLFVDRVTYNFRHPKRGEIIIFASTGIPQLIQDTYYIKRLIATDGEKVRLGNDRHVIINGQRLDASTPHFENVYSFKGAPQESTYSGHVNQKVVEEFHGFPTLSPLFPDEKAEIKVGQGRYFVMGDNTMNSFDCRAWGFDPDANAYGFPKKKVIGRASFVFWPISPRFGWGNR